MFFNQSMPLREMKAGNMIFNEGQPGEECYLITAGWVEIFRVLDGQEVGIAKLREQMLFGEMALIDNAPRMATARALTNCMLMVITRKIFDQHMRRLTPFMGGVVRMLVSNLREAQRKECELEFMLHRANMLPQDTKKPA